MYGDLTWRLSFDADLVPSAVYSRCFISGKEKQRSTDRKGETKEEGEKRCARNSVKWCGSSDNLRSTIRPYSRDKVPPCDAWCVACKRPPFHGKYLLRLVDIALDLTTNQLPLKTYLSLYYSPLYYNTASCLLY